MALLRPPTYEENIWTNDILFRRYKITKGISLFVTDGVVTERIYPTLDEIAAGDYDYFYQGGMDHTITSTEVAILVAAGYGDYIE